MRRMTSLLLVISCIAACFLLMACQSEKMPSDYRYLKGRKVVETFKKDVENVDKLSNVDSKACAVLADSLIYLANNSINWPQGSDEVKDTGIELIKICNDIDSTVQGYLSWNSKYRRAKYSFNSAVSNFRNQLELKRFFN